MIIKAGQVAVVTGAAQGLGRALTAGLIDRGVSVVLADIAAEQLHSTAEEFTAQGPPVLPVITDVSDPASVKALASRTLDHFGRVDIVVNNAGITGKSSHPLWQTEPQDWQRVLGGTGTTAAGSIEGSYLHPHGAGGCGQPHPRRGPS